MRERLAGLGLGAVIVFALTACSSDPPAQEPARHPLIGPTWTLTHVKDSNGGVDVPPQVLATITFGTGTVKADDGCKILTAHYTRDGARVTLADPRTDTSLLCTLTDRAHNAALAGVDAVMRSNGPDSQTHLPVHASVAGDTLTVDYGDVVSLRFSYAAS